MHPKFWIPILVGGWLFWTGLDHLSGGATRLQGVMPYNRGMWLGALGVIALVAVIVYDIVKFVTKTTPAAAAPEASQAVRPAFARSARTCRECGAPKPGAVCSHCGR